MQPLFWQENLGLLIATTRRRIKQVLWHRLRGFGLTPPQFTAMLVLAQECPLSLKSLADHLGTDAPTSCRIVEHLKQKKLVVASPDPEDRRRSALVLTPRGRKLSEDMRSMLSELDFDIERGLSPRAREALRSALRKIIDNMDEVERARVPTRPRARTRATTRGVA